MWVSDKMVRGGDLATYRSSKAVGCVPWAPTVPELGAGK